MNNRHRAAVRGASRKTRKTVQIDLICDIQVKAKVEQVVMIWANVKGRKVVEDLWPDVEWATDEFFSPMHSPDWLFTHIRVTKLPPDLEEGCPLTFAPPDAVGCAVATALQRLAAPERVAHFADDTVGLYFYDIAGPPLANKGLSRSLFAEYVPRQRLIGIHAVLPAGTAGWMTSSGPFCDRRLEAEHIIDAVCRMA